MSLLTSQQLIQVETDTTYKETLRMEVLKQSSYWKGQNGVGLANAQAAEEWFKGRQLAEDLLQVPHVSVDRQYWSSRSMKFLAELDLTGITGTSTLEDILNAILAQNHYPYIATNTYNQERDKKLF